MRFSFVQVLFGLLGVPWSVSATNMQLDDSSVSIVKKTFQSRDAPDVGLRFVSDSGVCETTPGVHQMSGYVTVGTNMSMWFWFFEARQSPETAPFTLWLNGGPGCSSMLGLFAENGPCTVNSDKKTTTNNAYSWNNLSNMIYIDQPIGAGFSFGTETANNTVSAAPFLWQAFQVFFKSGEFSKYKSREFILATESFGGHWGPAFVNYFNEQSQLIEVGKLGGEKVVFSALIITNGWIDPIIQSKSHIDFATNAPGYGPLQNDTVIKQMNEIYYAPDGCLERAKKCYAAGNSPASNQLCSDSASFCIKHIKKPAEHGYHSFDLRQKPNSASPFPSYNHIGFLNDPEIRKKIGAEIEFNPCSSTVAQTFHATGDNGRTMLPQLAKLVDSGLKTLIWNGDADIGCDWLGGQALSLAMDWYGKERLNNTPLTNITLHGKTVAAVRSVDNFSFARIYEAGHEIPAYQPEAALEIFRQIINKEPLHSV